MEVESELGGGREEEVEVEGGGGGEVERWWGEVVERSRVRKRGEPG